MCFVGKIYLAKKYPGIVFFLQTFIYDNLCVAYLTPSEGGVVRKTFSFFLRKSISVHRNEFGRNYVKLKSLIL